jgi:hypothetical protein
MDGLAGRPVEVSLGLCICKDLLIRDRYVAATQRNNFNHLPRRHHWGLHPHKGVGLVIVHNYDAPLSVPVRGPLLSRSTHLLPVPRHSSHFSSFQ